MQGCIEQGHRECRNQRIWSGRKRRATKAREARKARKARKIRKTWPSLRGAYLLIIDPLAERAVEQFIAWRTSFASVSTVLVLLIPTKAQLI